MSLALKIQYEGQNRRLRIPAKEGDFTIEDVNQFVASVFKSFEGRTFSFSYLDDEGDEAQIASTIELQEALACAGTKQANGDWQLKLKVKVNGDEPACLRSMVTPSEEKKEKEEEKKEKEEEKEKKEKKEKEEKEEEKKEKEEKEEEKKEKEEKEEEKKEKEKKKEEEEEEKSLSDCISPISYVHLTDLFDEHVINNPFFVKMREDFVKFAQDVRNSMPRDFPEKTRTRMEQGFENIRQPVANFATEVQKNYKEIRVPEGWKQNPLIVQLSDSLKNGREEMNSRMERWNQAQDQLVQMGFEDSPFIQRVLIMIHDGDLRKVLDDLLVRQGQIERIDTTFQNLVTSIACLFQNLDAHGAAFYQRSSNGLQVLGGHIQAGASSSAQYIQTQIDANQENIAFLQNKLDRNIRTLRATLDHLNDAASKNLVDGLAHGASQILKNIQEVQRALEEASEVKRQAREEAAKEEAKEETPAEVMMGEIPTEEVKEDTPKDPRLEESLKVLQEMGFVDIGKCSEILIASNFDMEAVLDQM